MTRKLRRTFDDKTELPAKIEVQTVFDDQSSILEEQFEDSTNKLTPQKVQPPNLTVAYTNWMAFIDLFGTSVDINLQLSKSEKNSSKR